MGKDNHEVTKITKITKKKPENIGSFPCIVLFAS